MKRVFISYAHDDMDFCRALAVHLQVLCIAGIIERWHDAEIAPGEDWKVAIEQQLLTADIVVLLVSASFLASQTCQDLELAPALRRWKSRRLFVLPVIIRACDWEASLIAQLQVLPSQAKPVATWSHPDDAWAEVTRRIRIIATGARNETRAGARRAAFVREQPVSRKEPQESVVPKSRMPVAPSSASTTELRSRPNKESDLPWQAAAWGGAAAFLWGIIATTAGVLIYRADRGSVKAPWIAFGAFIIVAILANFAHFRARTSTLFRYQIGAVLKSTALVVLYAVGGILFLAVFDSLSNARVAEEPLFFMVSVFTAVMIQWKLRAYNRQLKSNDPT